MTVRGGGIPRRPLRKTVFKLGRNPKRVTHVRVMVTHDGLYDMTFYGTCPLSQGPSKRPADRARQALSRSGRMAAAHERTGGTI